MKSAEQLVYYSQKKNIYNRNKKGSKAERRTGRQAGEKRKVQINTQMD